MFYIEGMDREMELIARIKEHDDDAFRQLLEDYRRIIYKIIYSFNLEMGDFMMDMDEMYQEASLSLYEAVMSFEMDKKMKFSSFAYMVIRRRLISLLRSYRHKGGEPLSLDKDDYQLIEAATLVNDNPEAYHREKDFEEFLDGFIDGLNEEDRKLIEYRNADLSYKEIAERLKVSNKRIDNRLRLLKKRFKEEYRRKNGITF